MWKVSHMTLCVAASAALVPEVAMSEGGRWLCNEQCFAGVPLGLRIDGGKTSCPV